MSWDILSLKNQKKKKKLLYYEKDNCYPIIIIIIDRVESYPHNLIIQVVVKKYK